MSVIEADDRDHGTVVHYAPRHVRYPSEERSIRPVLERLRRGESGARADEPVEPAVDLAFPINPPRRVFGWQMMACSVLSAGLSAGLVVLATGWLTPSKTEMARIDSTQLEPKIVEPKIVQTAFAQPTQAADVQPTQAFEADQAAADKSDAKPEAAASPEPQRDNIAPRELLTMWSGVPAALEGDTAITLPGDSPKPDVQDTKDAQAEPPAAARSERVEPPPRRHTRARTRHHRRGRTHAVARRPAPAQDSAAAQAQTAEPNALQSALQSFFGQPSASAQPARPQSGSAAPAPAQSQPQNY